MPIRFCYFIGSRIESASLLAGAERCDLKPGLGLTRKREGLQMTILPFAKCRNTPTTVIVRTGPYRFSRNPIYLEFSLFQLGIAI
jgi:hypothetical protein